MVVFEEMMNLIIEKDDCRNLSLIQMSGKSDSVDFGFFLKNQNVSFHVVVINQF
jgi:hypothetical protein